MPEPNKRRPVRRSNGSMRYIKIHHCSNAPSLKEITRDELASCRQKFVGHEINPNANDRTVRSIRHSFSNVAIGDGPSNLRFIMVPGKMIPAPVRDRITIYIDATPDSRTKKHRILDIALN